SGAGALNYGHNHPDLKQKLKDFIEKDGLAMSLDMATPQKEEFLLKFNESILKPRNMDYKVMFPGPTGTNSVETALKLARKLTGRHTIINFTNAYHGMTLGSLSVSGNKLSRSGAGVPLTNTNTMPYDNYFEDETDTSKYLEKMLADQSSAIEKPAAIIVETVQGQGGIKVAKDEWLKSIQDICRRYDIMFIVDDIQAGCGRVGTFFSFENIGLDPDIICISKSISGYGLPLALTLFKQEIDIWEPGEHTETIRGNTLVFVTAIETLKFWEDSSFEKRIIEKGKKTRAYLEKIAKKFPRLELEVRGRGLMNGIASPRRNFGEEVCKEAFKQGMIMDKCGPNGEVPKLFPPINIDDELLDKGLVILEKSIESYAFNQV